ncbi:YdiU family protein [Actinoplanes sp. NEAU-A12]|uniref:Protein nucleotidyltransferase YdiU n=1 Tax=Actinoplanes sandaracinus TaxID=3045177 RepID=A0ABT6WUN2_9ACTN|nr:YdiU family protein [Actinoplanes sandaracinus]MDI6103447.1 YdiU family protein [Actinoplanes sandaracinus]
MSDAPTLGTRFADELPEMAVPWQAAEPPAPRLLVLNEPLAAELGLDAGWLRGPDGLRFLTGTGLPDGAKPVAQAYAGHQFGGYSPRLGDGRALLLGEIDGRDLHLKGSGRTPFARGGDGLAAVGPMLREFVISEAMHALGIPTTRSLAVIATGKSIVRDNLAPGAILVRVAASHLRVGSFQFARATGDDGLLRRLADHALSRHHPGAGDAFGLYRAVVGAQADLVADWMLTGFVHGVMNTDNMTISGETIDYGPCAFMDAFDPATVFSSIDEGGRYAYGNQPTIAQWNLARLAEAMLPLFDDDQDRAIAKATEALGGFRTRYAAATLAGFRAKLGLREADTALTEDLLALLKTHRTDFTSFFRQLAADEAARRAGEPAQTARRTPEESPDPFLDWIKRWRALDPDLDAMNRANPVYIPRNHLVEEALAAATDGDLAPLHRLLEAVTAPFDERPGLARFAEPAPPDFGAYRTFCGT